MAPFDFIIGIMGMFLILLAFVLDEFYTRFNQNTVWYNVLNIIGSGLLVYYAWTLRGWPFLVLNAVWFGAAFVKLVRIIQK